MGVIRDGFLEETALLPSEGGSLDQGSSIRRSTEAGWCISNRLIGVIVGRLYSSVLLCPLCFSTELGAQYFPVPKGTHSDKGFQVGNAV